MTLDRFDLMLQRIAPAPAIVPPVVAAPSLPRVVERQPVITSKRPARFVDHTACPMCGVDRQGVEYHGTLLSGAKVHQIAAHTAGMRRVQSGQPRCLGAAMRIVFVDGMWKGAPSP